MANTSVPYVPVLTVVGEPGNIMYYTNNGAATLSPGDPVPMAACFGVAIPAGDVPGLPGVAFPVGIPVGGSGPVCIHGRITGPATSVSTWSQGAALYWDATNGVFSTTSTGGNTPAGYAFGPKISGQTLVEVKLPY